MDMKTTTELCFTEETRTEAMPQPLSELSDLQLAFVGGGIADLINA